MNESVNDWMMQEVTFSIVMSGMEMSSEEALTMESHLLINDDCEESRLKLLGYYFELSNLSTEFAQKWLALVQWFILHEPEHQICRSPWTQVPRLEFPHEYELIKRAWRDRIKGSKNAIRSLVSLLICNAEHEEAKDILQEQILAEPTNPEWHARLGHVYERLAESTGRDYWLSAITEYTSACELPEADLIECSAKLPLLALNAGCRDAAKVYAAELQARAAAQDITPEDRDFLIHRASNVTGILELEEGNIELAKECLRKAAKSSASWRLSLQGPDMNLAVALNKIGEWRSAVEYLICCREAGNMGCDQYDEWQRSIEESHSQQSD